MKTVLRIGTTVAESSAFVKATELLWTEAELDALKLYLALNPASGDEIPGTGGLRKLRWSRVGMGKRGGSRVIYFYFDDSAPIFLLAAYAKAQQEDLSPDEKRLLSRAVAVLKASIKNSKKRQRHD